MSCIAAVVWARGSGDSEISLARCVSREASKFVDGGSRVAESLVSGEQIRGVGACSLSSGATGEGRGCDGTCVSPALTEGEGAVEVDAESPYNEDLSCGEKTSPDSFGLGSVLGPAVAGRGHAEFGNGEPAEEPGCGVI